VRRVLVGLHNYHHFPAGEQQKRIKRYDQMFKALLAEKARQEVLNKMSNYNSRNTEDAGARKADDTGSSIGVGDILKQEVAGCGQ
jgi:tRNA G37 N-methylase TrmD